MYYVRNMTMFKKIITILGGIIIIYYRSLIITSLCSFLKGVMTTLCLIILSLTHPLVKPLVVFIKEQRQVRHYSILNQELQHKNRELQAQLIESRSLSYTHNTLKPLAEYAQRYRCSLIKAQVIGRILSDHVQVLQLNKGSQHGISKDMMGIWYNYCIGKVYEVNPYSCTLILITDKRCAVPSVSVESGVHGIARGLNKSDSCALEYVEHTKNLATGMNIMSSGMGSIFAQGFAIGTLRTLIKRSLYYEAFIELDYQPEDIEYCYLGSKVQIEG